MNLTFPEQTKLARLLYQYYEQLAPIIENQLASLDEGSTAIAYRWGILNQLRTLDSFASFVLKDPAAKDFYNEMRSIKYAEAVRGIKFLEGEPNGKE